MECDQPFKDHGKTAEAVCRQHALTRRTTYSNISYLNEGFKKKEVK